MRDLGQIYKKIKAYFLGEPENINLYCLNKAIEIVKITAANDVNDVVALAKSIREYLEQNQ